MRVSVYCKNVNCFFYHNDGDRQLATYNVHDMTTHQEKSSSQEKVQVRPVWKQDI